MCFSILYAETVYTVRIILLQHYDTIIDKWNEIGQMIPTVTWKIKITLYRRWSTANIVQKDLGLLDVVYCYFGFFPRFCLALTLWISKNFEKILRPCRYVSSSQRGKEKKKKKKKSQATEIIFNSRPVCVLRFPEIRWTWNSLQDRHGYQEEIRPRREGWKAPQVIYQS